MKCKTFDTILREMNFRPHKFGDWVKDKRLTQLEKKIILGYQFIRNNQNSKAVAEIRDLPLSGIEFVNAHKHLLMGIALNNQSLCDEALTELQKARDIFGSLNIDYYTFNTCFNLFIVYNNLRDMKGMEQVLMQMRLLKPDSEMMNLRLMRCEFMFADESDQNDLARKWLSQISTQREKMPESDQIGHLVSECMFLVKTEHLQDAMDVLNKTKQFRKFHLSENYNYMKKLLENLLFHIPVYAYKENFMAVPILWHQIDVVKSLEAGDTASALKSWNELQRMMPEVFQDNFEYKGAQCLFSLCLKKHHKTKMKSPVTLDDAGDASLLKKVVSLFENSDQPINKGHLYEILWGNPPETKDDINRLARLVFKAKKKYGLDIKTRKGTYFLDRASIKKAV